MKKVFVSGCYDLLHSGHIEFFRQASRYGDLYVGIGSDSTILEYKRHHTLYNENERLFMVRSIRYVKDACINSGSGVMDFIPTVDALKPDIFVVNEDGDRECKRQFCKERGIEYIVLKRTAHEGMACRSSTDIKESICRIPTRIDIAGTWIDQPYVSCKHPGWAITVSINPTFPIMGRSGLATSTRNSIRKIWPLNLPSGIHPQTLAKLVFCYENDPEHSDGFISGAQDALGICMPGISRHYYDNHFWPEKIESCSEGSVMDWLQKHLCLVHLFPRRDGYDVTSGKNITESTVSSLALAADECWKALICCNLQDFAQAFGKSFAAQVALFPAMVPGEVRSLLDEISSRPGVLAHKLSGAGGGGYAVLVVEDSRKFCCEYADAIKPEIRRK